MLTKQSSSARKASGVVLGLVILSVVAASYTHVTKTAPAQSAFEDSKVGKLKLQPGFKAEHLYSPSENEQGSWVSMAFDHKGRMIVSDQYGGLFRLQIPAIGAASVKPTVEKLKIGSGSDTLEMGAAQGLLYAFNSLYVVVNNRASEKLPRGSGLYRLQDTNGDDQFDKVTLMKAMVGDGEHGPHSIILSPDKQSLYVIAGNHTDLPPLDAYRLPTNWKDDNLFPLIKDPRGHANDRHAPGGWIAQLDPDGKKWELISAGYRNAFDMAFNEVGDLFVYDADMEWDFGLPWYRPTRICHATSASEFGWRTGNAKWSPTFADNLPPIINIGQGSPTNLLHTKDARFPAKYKHTLLAFDWSFGIIHAIHLKPSGSTYAGEREEFLSGIPLPLTDGTIGPDGALYFLTGGRRLESDLYRVSYEGSESTAPVAAKPINAENQLRRNLEKYHTGGPNKQAINDAWPQLKNPDRFVRYAARLAVEHQPVAEWQQKALQEKDPIIATNALIALARHGDVAQKAGIFKALTSINFKALTEPQQLDVLRATELTLSRMGQPDAAQKTALVAFLDPNYPAKSAELNRALSKVLITIEAPGVISKTLALLEKKEGLDLVQAGGDMATASSDLIMRNPQYGLDIAGMLEKMPPAQQTYYATMLSAAKTGWTPELQERYFKWFRGAFSYKGGRSYIGFIDKARKLALANVPEAKRGYFDKLSGGELLTSNGNDLVVTNYPKGPGKRWQLEQAMTVVDNNLHSRNYQQGKDMYLAITCARCHTMRGEGGNVGPDLTQLATRFSAKDMLEAIIDPSKAVSDQYAATQFILKSGESIVGRLTNEDKNAYYVSQNPFAPDMLQKILKKDVVSSKYSAVSVMLPGLINSLNEEELKDLMAYLMAGGNEKHPIYTEKAAASPGK
ncbi:putative heme-binding domain-containing protein [Rhabdobacter roseus]|uniref:Putative heme-binding domain-containing protein n=1 Tax=Rhabdobacter roseus TaxID=1655419 RepID=A0A840TMA7_9BACT|nr:c-type cytochrome [Rhabdobacter roseus]MBB5282887.1 putative heme-binding domain-containing protein [Rhabdobacter roseus]